MIYLSIIVLHTILRRLERKLLSWIFSSFRLWTIQTNNRNLLNNAENGLGFKV